MEMTFLPTSTPTFCTTPTTLRCSGGACGPDNEVRAAEDIDMQRMVLQHKRVIDQFANLARGGRRFDLVKVIQRLGGRHVVRRRANPADAAGDLRHLLRGPAEAEDLETAQLGTCR